MERSRLIVNFDSSSDKLLSTENVVACGETFDILFRDVTLSGAVRVAFWDYETLLWRSEGSASQGDGGSVLEGLVADTKELTDVFRGGSGFFAAQLTVGEQVGGDEWRDYGVAYVRLYRGTDPSENPEPARPDVYPTEDELNAWLEEAGEIAGNVASGAIRAEQAATSAEQAATNAQRYASDAASASISAAASYENAEASRKAADSAAQVARDARENAQLQQQQATAAAGKANGYRQQAENAQRLAARAQEAAETAQEAAEEAQSAADGFASDAAQSAQEADAKADEANQAAAAADSASSDAQTAKVAAENAKADAQAAKQAAETAKAGAETAKTDAEAAADEAATSATNAAASAEEAASSAKAAEEVGATAREYEFPHFSPDSPLLVKAWGSHLDNNATNLYAWAIVHPPSNAVYANTRNYRGEGYAGEPCILMATAEGGYYYTQYAPNLCAPDTEKYVYLLDKDYKLVQRFNVTNLTAYNTFNASCAAVGGKFFAAYVSKLHRFDIATGTLEKTVSYSNNPWYAQRYLQMLKWNPRSGHLVLTVENKTWLFDTELNNLGEAEGWGNQKNSYGFVYEGSLYIFSSSFFRVDEADALTAVACYEADGETPLAVPFKLMVNLHEKDAERYPNATWTLNMPAITYDQDVIVRVWDGVRLFNARLDSEGHLELVLASESKSGHRNAMGLFATNITFRGKNNNAIRYAYLDFGNKTVYIVTAYFTDALKICEEVKKDYNNPIRPVVTHVSGNEGLHIPTTHGTYIITISG